MAQSTIDREDYAHPEKIYKDLVLLPNGSMLDEDKPKREGVKTCFSRSRGEPDKELCWSCGWSTNNELMSSYGSRIRIFHTEYSTGIWEVGSRWLIRDQPNNAAAGNDFITQEFLRNQPNSDIPLVKEMRKLSAPTDKVELTLMSRWQGVGLNTIWHTLSPEQKSSYKDQLGNVLKKLRQFTSPVASNVDGGLMDDRIIADCNWRYPCKKTGYTTEEWLENLEKDLRFGLSLIHETKDPVVIEEKFQELKKKFPKSEPYVLTHGCLDLSKIIVKDGKIEAIIDWKFSGYMPWWAERWLTLQSGTNQDDELFEPLWTDIGFEMDDETFRKEVFAKVGDFREVWNKCEFYVKHKDLWTQWMRPGFCECKPYAGYFQLRDIGMPVEHELGETRNRYMQ